MAFAAAVIVAGTVTAAAGGSASDAADQNIYVEPALVLADIAPGNFETFTLTVRSEVETDLRVSAEGLGQDPDGGFRTLEEGEDPGAYTAQPYLKVTPSTIHLEPNGEQKVQLTINVPKDAGDGGRYAVVEFASGAESEGEDDDEGDVGFSASVGATVVVTLEGTEQQRTGNITDISLDRTSTKTLVKATLQNTGNYHYGNTPHRMIMGATLLDPQGNQIGASVTPMTDGSVVPSFMRELATPLPVARDLKPGKYTVEVQFSLENGTILDTDSRDFTLTESDVLGRDATPGPDPSAAPPKGGDGDDFWKYLLLIVGVSVATGLIFFFIFGRRRRRDQEGS